MISNSVNDSSQLNICLNKNRKGSVSCSLLKPLEDYSKCELITLTLKHMFKVFFTTLPVTISVCLTGFGLSKLPYTNSCTKNVTDTSCAYYNKLILFGVNRVVRLVSTWYIIFMILFAFQVVIRVKIAATWKSRFFLHYRADSRAVLKEARSGTLKEWYLSGISVTKFNYWASGQLSSRTNQDSKHLKR